MKTPLLTLVQDILEAMNSDPVDTSDETEESRQVTRICQDVFYDLQSIREWPHKAEVIQLTASGDINQPTRMQLPIDVHELISVRYDKQILTDTEARYAEVHFLDPEVWLKRSLELVLDNDNVTEIIDDVQGFLYRVMNDRSPNYYTSFDDDYIWFDNFDSSIENTLQSSKTIIRAFVATSFSQTDTFEPDVPNKDWALYKNTCLDRAYAEIKQARHPTAGANARRLLIRAQKHRGHRIDGGPKVADYGRR